MCGLVGTASVEQVRDKRFLSRCRDTITHRGPDDFGEWWSIDGRVGFGHRRLAIVDLSPLGHQPMQLADHGLTVTFNGEIYNYLELRAELIKLGFTFKSQSDTEVLLAAYAQWGEGCIGRLNGMFALALYDRKTNKLFLARDRAGEKPLYYRITSKEIRFASELKALLCDREIRPRLNREAMDCYMAFGYVAGNRCILDGFHKLPPAHALSFDLNSGDVRVWRYWSLPAPPSASLQVSEESLLDELESLLEDAVGRQLMADVSVGILLSGGVDSSLITAMAVRRSARVRTFSVGFPGHGKFDESPHARLIASHFGTDHSELVAEPATADLVERLATQFDEPIVDSSMIPTYLLCRLVRQYCTVALGGDGGDELFAGYPEYSRLLRLQEWDGRLPRWPRKLVAQLSTRMLPLGFAGGNLRTWLLALGDDLSKELPLIGCHFDLKARRALFKNTPDSMQNAETIRRSNVPVETDLLQRTTRMDFAGYLAEDILVKVDRASMLNSLEVRAPLLDHRVIEFAFGRVASRFKATPKNKKVLLKLLATKVLPEKFDRQRKQGFSIPLKEWLKSGPFRELFWDTLSSTRCCFERAAVRSLLRGQDSGRDNGERLFALVQFELWKNHYGVEI